MKRIAFVWLAVGVMAGLLVATAGAQTDSLGDYARTARKGKEKQAAASRKFDNDNLPKNDALSVVGNVAQEPAPGAANSGDKAASSGDKTEAQPAPATSAADQQKLYDQWKQRIAEQKNQIDMLSRELDVVQREYRLRAAAFYADAGNRLRNSGAWDKEDAQYKQQIAAKQKALDAAKQQLEDLQEQARKAGVPSSVRQ
jgi:hypothetical protein